MRDVLVASLLGACSFQPGAVARAIDPPPTTDIDAPVDTTAMIDAGLDAPRCPADFVPFGSSVSVYKAMITPASYATAVTACEGLGANVQLVRLDTQAETDALYTFMDDAITVGDTVTRVVARRHVNGIGPSDDTWHDLDDVAPLAFLPWGAGEPTSLTGEDCMSLRDEFGPSIARVTGADDCITLRPSACECQ